jgi:hypothetical protein
MYALSALRSETMNSHWVTQLSAEEAQHATKLSMIELNGFAEFLPALARTHYDEVRHVITGELSAQIKNLSNTESAPLLMRLQNLGDTKLKSSMAHWLLDMFDLFPNEISDGANNALVSAIDFVVEHIDLDDRKDVVQIIKKRLEGCHALSTEQAAWIRAFAVLHPQAGCYYLVKTINEYQSQAEIEFGISLLKRIFGQNGHFESKPDFTSMPESQRPALVVSLVETAYRITHRTTDIKNNNTYCSVLPHYSEEQARIYLFGLLMEMKCPETHSALVRFSSLPEFGHMKSRLLKMKTELAASASEPQAMPIEHIILFDKKVSLTPMNNEMIHKTTLDILIDYKHSLKYDEFSNRGTLRLVKQEMELRRNIASWINSRSRGLYSVTQEAVKVNENRTDIRLNFAAVNLESVIELKLDDQQHRWSGAALEKALRNQLVGKYLSHQRCHSGFLLIVQREKRCWQHPKSGEMMELPALISWLQRIASEIVRSRPEIMVSVVGIDISE